jgi:uncharacterized protein (TIGR03382 family)
MKATLLIAAAAYSVWAPLAQAAVIVAPPGLSLGDHYRLIFVTLNSRNATSSNIDDYNQFVTQAASSVAALQALGATWTAIASTSTVSALTNIGSSSLPIYRLDGLLVANDTADLFDGAINAKVNITNTGVSLLGANVWTGSTSAGAILLPLGAVSGFVTTGTSDRTDGGWLNRQIPVLPTSQFRLYGISSELTSTVPEPGTLSLAVASLLVAVWRRRRHSRRQS